MNIKNCRTYNFLILTILSFPINYVLALSTSVSFKINQQVVSGCEVKTIKPIDFGSVSFDKIREKKIYSSGTLTIHCTPGTKVTVALDRGQYSLNDQRRMASSDGRFFILYDLYQDSEHTKMWITGVPYTPTITDYSNINIPLYASLEPTETPAAGDYSDIVTETINY